MKIKTYYTAILFVVLFLLSGCSGFLDINDDPNTPKKAELSKLLTNAEYGSADAFSGINSILPSYVFHLTSREVDNFSITANYASLGNTWNIAYLTALRDLDAIIVTATEEKNLEYAGIAKILKAYVFLNLVDLWGEIVYTEYNVETILAPKADEGAFVYNALLALIDEALADLAPAEASPLVPEKDDIFYGGNVKKWAKLANTLKLKILVQSRKAKNEIEGWNEKLTDLLASPVGFIGKAEDLELKHSKQNNPEERHPAYVSEYLGGQSTYYISPWIYETMKGLDLNVKDNPFVGIVDPRIPYYWVKQIKDGGVAQNPTDYRHEGFVSIVFASGSSFASNAQRKTSTFIGIYPSGGAYDDGTGVQCKSTVGNGVAPEKMLQAYSVPFLKAELYLTGEVAGDAKEQLEKGIRASFDHVNKVVAISDDSAPILKKEDVDPFVAAVLLKYDAATDDNEKLRIVMTQKWIANFFNPIEAYNDYRRTGFPILLDPNATTMQSPFNSTPEPAPGPAIIPLKGLNSYPRAMFYPNGEVRNNVNISNAGRDLSKPIVFWDK